jgi:xanthosine utilization system XapX-like protein
LNLGYGVCLVGAVVMLLGRFRPGAPRELVYVGLAGIVFGWGLFALVIWRRVSLARRRASSLQARGLGEGTVD